MAIRPRVLVQAPPTGPALPDPYRHVHPCPATFIVSHALFGPVAIAWSYSTLKPTPAPANAENDGRNFKVWYLD